MSTATTIIEALGGWENISNLEACITRIRLDAANTDLIDEATPGVAYIGQDGVPEAARVRFTHVTDADITALTQQYAPQHSPARDEVLPVAGGGVLDLSRPLSAVAIRKDHR